MSTLVDYGSSDEDDGSLEVNRKVNASTTASSDEIKNRDISEIKLNGTSPQNTHGTVESARSIPEYEVPLVGPSLAPAMEMEVDSLEQDLDQSNPQLSPYSANRALLRDLTLPTLPSYDIPPSPPGSPRENTDAKFKHFLELKKQGVHFNQKLANSSALKNPSLMEKLMDFSNIDELGQYETTLPRGLWNPGVFPDYAYKEELAKSQQKILKKKEDEKARGQRESVDFVPAAGADEVQNRTGTPSTSGKQPQKVGSAAERVMAGLDRGRSSSPHVQGIKRKSRFDA